MIRAKLYFIPDRGRRRGRHGTTGTWAYRVEAPTSTGFKTVFCDNTGGTTTRVPARLFRQAELDVYAARRVINAGHQFKRGFMEDDK